MLFVLVLASVAHGNDFARSIRQREQVTKGLVAYYSMRNSGTTVYDEIGTNNGSAINGPTFAIASGLVASGASLDGNNDYILPSASSTLTFGTGDFSVSVWFKASSISGVRNIIRASYASNAGAWGIFLFSNLIYAHARSSAAAFKGAENAFTDTTAWHHAVLVRKSSIVYGYLDGAAMTTTGVTGADFNCAGNGRAYIGAVDDSSGGAKEFFAGLLDEYRIYNRALTADEIKQLYRMGKTVFNNR
jgi:hypothetical protein